MKERPILFSAPMVRAILAGQKTQTRRIVKPQPDHRTTRVSICRDQWMGNGPSGNGVGTAQWDPWRKSPFAVGDRLWVRETWLPDPPADDDAWDDNSCTYFEWSGCGSRIDSVPAQLQKPDHCIYREGWEGHDLIWRPSIHMPRWASRILLEVVSVRVERLQDISEADADAEGCERLDFEREERDCKLCPQCGGTRLHAVLGRNGGVIPDCDCRECDTYVKRFRYLWESINGNSSLAANPWVWVVEFRRVEP